MTSSHRPPLYILVSPPLAFLFYVAAQWLGFGNALSLTPLGIAFAVALMPILIGTVFAAVFHAEAIAHRLGEPYGTLILTLAVTVIEVALIVSIMLAGDSKAALARDTVFAVIMIVCNGLVGLCIVVGGLRYRQQGFRVSGASAYLNVLIALSTLVLVLPNFTKTVVGPYFSVSQLVFASVVTALLYAAFLYIQTVRHSEFFIAQETDIEPSGLPSARLLENSLGWSAAMLIISLIGVILLAKKFAAVSEVVLTRIGAPEAVAGVIVALLVLLPESVAALQAAKRDKLQNSLNLALGSSLATIGLTIPAVAAVAIYLGKPLILGLDEKDTVLLALTMIVSLLTFGQGRTNILSGFVHLVIFATFLFLLVQP